jgi:hypothetical protein
VNCVDSVSGQNAISNYRHGRTQMSDETAVAMAAMIGRAPAPILAQLAAERAKSPEVAKV